MYQDGPDPVGRKISVMSVEIAPPLGSPSNSGGARSPARFAPPRGRGGDRSAQNIPSGIAHRDLLLAEESGRERLITPAFLPRNTGIATIVADGNTEQLSRCCCACFATAQRCVSGYPSKLPRIPYSGADCNTAHTAMCARRESADHGGTVPSHGATMLCSESPG